MKLTLTITTIYTLREGYPTARITFSLPANGTGALLNPVLDCQILSEETAYDWGDFNSASNMREKGIVLSDLSWSALETTIQREINKVQNDFKNYYRRYLDLVSNMPKNTTVVFSVDEN